MGLVQVYKIPATAPVMHVVSVPDTMDLSPNEISHLSVQVPESTN